MAYTISYPSGILRKDGVILTPLDDTNPDYVDYIAWLNDGNGPDMVPDPVPTATPAQVNAALTQLGLSTVTAEQLAGDVFNLALTL